MYKILTMHILTSKLNIHWSCDVLTWTQVQCSIFIVRPCQKTDVQKSDVCLLTISCTELGRGLPVVVRVDSSSYWSKMEAMMQVSLYTFFFLQHKATRWNQKLNTEH